LAATPMPAQLQNEPAHDATASAVPVKPPRTERLRVLHIVSHLGMGGTEHGVLKVMKGLGEYEFEHRICAVRAIDADFAARMDVAGRTYSAGSGRPGFQFPMFRLRRIMKQFRPHIVHTRNFGALEAIPAAMLAGVPATVHSEHGYELEILRGLPFRRRMLCRAFYAMADAVFTVTNDLGKYHSEQSGLPVEKFRVLYNGVNTETFLPRPEVSVRRKSELGIPAERLVLGTVGRLVPIKDQRTLLRAAELLVRQNANVHVLVVGAGPELANLQAQVAASAELPGRVTFSGASDRVAELLGAMDIFVLSSICEGMSNTIIEAMASGLPVVATRAGGNPELVKEDHTGCLFDPGDVRRLSELILRFTEDPDLRREFGRAARCRAVELFSLTGMIHRYRSLYVDLAARRGVLQGA
jgi:sugar transferase (PEP-CTERM/EpsH1 system associated)